MPKRILVTGVAGFIGSHLTDRLVDSGFEVVGIDNLSTGTADNLSHAITNPLFKFVKADLLDGGAIAQAIGECDLIYHLAADPEVRTGASDPSIHFTQNIQATFVLLEALRKRKTPTRLVFVSTSTVYGEPSVIPTPENYGPLLPISTYGATKLACEALASSYTELLPLQVLMFRFANVVGSRAKHGVLHDFINKLGNNPRELEILGDGTQSKSYLHIDDCIDAFMKALDDVLWDSAASIYNIGTEQRTSVLRIAEIVAQSMNLANVTYTTTQPQGGRAWPGDAKTMQLDISNMKKRGWQPRYSSDQAVHLASRQLTRDPLEPGRRS
ncbi:MAG: NAD-dependent epimerase/dehydratase family protein [Candidatus Bathyarchaeia archaeon]